MARFTSPRLPASSFRRFWLEPVQVRFLLNRIASGRRPTRRPLQIVRIFLVGADAVRQAGRHATEFLDDRFDLLPFPVVHNLLHAPLYPEERSYQGKKIDTRS